MEWIKEALLRVAAKSDARVTEQDEWLLLSMGGESGVVWHSFLHCAEEERLLLGYLLCPGTVPHAEYEQTASTIGRLNTQLKFGTFVLGEEWGEIRFRFSQFFPPMLEGNDAEDFVYRILRIATEVADACLPKFRSHLKAWEETDVPD